MKLFYFIKSQIIFYNLMSGFYPPSGGTAIIRGHDIRKEMSEVQSSLGLCPQHDILFDSLTVEEHVIFFGLVCVVIAAAVEVDTIVTAATIC